MQTECGVTEISLANAKELFDSYGHPVKVTCVYDPDEWWQVHVEWDSYDYEHKHVFSGFAWGYSGEGVRGLQRFLEVMCGILDIPYRSLVTMDRYDPTELNQAVSEMLGA